MFAGKNHPPLLSFVSFAENKNLSLHSPLNQEIKTILILVAACVFASTRRFALALKNNFPRHRLGRVLFA